MDGLILHERETTTTSPTSAEIFTVSRDNRPCAITYSIEAAMNS
jgi:hypothetical protein